MMKMYGLGVSPWGFPLKILNCLEGYPSTFKLYFLLLSVEYSFDNIDKVRAEVHEIQSCIDEFMVDAVICFAKIRQRD